MYRGGGGGGGLTFAASEPPVVSSASDLHYCPVTQFIGDLLKLLTCQNDKFGFQVQRHVQDLLGHELSTHCYPILFEQIKLIVDRFFDLSGQVCVTEQNTLFIENVIHIMKSVLEIKSSDVSSVSGGNGGVGSGGVGVGGGGSNSTSSGNGGAGGAGGGGGGVNGSNGDKANTNNSNNNNSGGGTSSGGGSGGAESPFSSVNVESLMINIVRYVRHLDSSVQIIQIKTKVILNF